MRAARPRCGTRTDLPARSGRAQPHGGGRPGTTETWTLAAGGGSTAAQQPTRGAALRALALSRLRRLLAAVRDLHGKHDQCGRAAGVGGPQLDTDAVTQ